MQLTAKEGLALLNGTQVSTALALKGLFEAEQNINAAFVAGSLTVEAALGSRTPFDERIQAVRLLEPSEIASSHTACNKVQDPYSLRCQPQVMGACLDQIRNAASIIEIEANAVSDNPLIFVEEGNSGFMIAQVTAAALASENKSHAHPASVDSLPTSANQEDHVSMATFAARRLTDMNLNTRYVVAVELLAACQGIDLRRPLKSNQRLEAYWSDVRSVVAYWDHDRYFQPDLEAISTLIQNNTFGEWANSFIEA